MSRIVVIGAGLGGLAAAARLAALGHEVTVCEQHERAGGKLGTEEREGFRWDTGPSLLTMPHLLAELFDDTGGSLESHLPITPVEPIAHYRFPDGTRLDASSDLDRFAAAADLQLSPGSGDDWRRFMHHAGAMFQAVEQPFMASPLRGARSLARQAVRVSDLLTIAPHRTLRSLGRRHLRDWRLRMMLDRYATYTGSDPRQAPAALAVIPYVEQHFGAWYVPGGLYGIVDAVMERARARGAVIRTAADVAAVELRNRRVAGVRLADGEPLAADAVVANADATHLYRDLLPPSATIAPRRQLSRTVPSLSGFVVLLGVSGTTPGLGSHTVLFPRDYDQEFDAIFGDRPRPVADPTLYLSVPRDPALAPAGSESWFLLVNAPRHGPVDWTSPGLSEEYADHLLAVLAARGIDLTDRIVTRCVITPADLERRTRTVGGAIYGTSSNGPRSAFLRPSNASPIPGLFLVGGSSHPGGGLPLVLLSARIVANLVGPA